MRKNLRFLSLATSLVLLVSTFAGCASKTATKDAPSTTQSAAKDTNSEKLEISVAMWNIQDGFDDPNAKNDTIYNELSEKFNFSIKPVQVTWNDWQDKFKIWAASNQLPDVFADDITRGDYNAWATQGVIKALPDDLSKYPNIKKVMSLPAVKPLAVNGKHYSFPRMTFEDSAGWANNRNIIYRKDWAKQAGFEAAPKNFDEFVTMTKAVLKQHPEAAGVATHHKGFLLTLYLGFFPEATSADSAWVKENDKWVPAYASSKFAEGLVQLRTLYSEGILDKDFSIQKDSDGTVKFMNGKSFAYFGDNAASAWSKNSEAFKKANPGVKAADSIGYLDIWPAADGNKYSFATTPYWSSTFFRASLEDKKMDRALQVLDYMYSEEYMLKASNGLEGKDYKVENGKSISLLKEGEALDKKYPITSKMGYLSRWSDSLPYTGKTVVSPDPDKAYLNQLNIDSFKEKQTKRKPMDINYDVMLMSTPAKDKIASLSTAFQDDMVKVIIGKEDPVKMWNNVLKSYEAKGLTKAIEEVTAEAKKQGIK